MTAVEHLSDKREPRELELTAVTETEFASTGDSKTTTAKHLSLGSETREVESTEAVLTETGSVPTGDSRRSESKGGGSIAIFASQAAQVAASLRGSASTVSAAIVIAGTLSAAAIGTALYLKTHRVGKTGMTNEVKASVIGWQENEHGAAAEIIGECVNRSINFKAMVLGRDGEPTVELPWNDKLEDYRNETGKFMQVMYLPITVKINDDEPQIVKRLHEEPYRNVIRLVTLLLEPTPGSDPGQSTGETKTVSAQLDNLLSTAEKAALTSYYPDKLLKISEARRIMIEFDTSKGTMQIRITIDEPIVQKLVELCESQ